MGSNLKLSKLIFGPKTDFSPLKSMKSISICTNLLPKTKKSKKQKINCKPLQATVLGLLILLGARLAFLGFPLFHRVPYVSLVFLSVLLCSLLFLGVNVSSF